MIDACSFAVPELPEQPWLNGGGATRVLTTWSPDPESAGEPHVRVSLARVEAAGPFSVWPGYERVLTLVSGEFLVLAHGDAAGRRVRLFDPYAFAGEARTTAELPGAAAQAFNVMTLRSAGRTHVQSLALGRRSVREALNGPFALVYVVSGRLTLRVTGEEEPYELAEGEVLRLAGVQAGDELLLQGRKSHCTVIVCTFEPGRPDIR